MEGATCEKCKQSSDTVSLRCSDENLCKDCDQQRLGKQQEVNKVHPLQRVKAKWNSDFRFGGKSAAASNKASHAASKSLLFSFVLDTFQAISVIFSTV